MIFVVCTIRSYFNKSIKILWLIKINIYIRIIFEIQYKYIVLDIFEIYLINA